MTIQLHVLAHGASLDISVPPAPSAGRAELAVVLGGGRGCTLRAEGPLLGLWMPLRGRLQLGDGMLQSGALRVSEVEARSRAVGRGAALWIALLGTLPGWRAALGDGATAAQPPLLPATHRAGFELRRRAIALARARDDQAAEALLAAFLECVLVAQMPLAECIDRCPGRTHAQRRQVFVRLQRVRNFIASNSHLELDNQALAKMASYSSWHFIRAFRAAFDETPHSYLVRKRLERARRLLRTSPLGIGEIALASGFENRCAFSRLFRERFGTTAGAVRREARMPVRAAG